MTTSKKYHQESHGRSLGRLCQVPTRLSLYSAQANWTVGSFHLSTTAIYSSWKKWQFCPHFLLWIKAANGCSSVASFRSLCPMCQQNCKPWHFYGHFSELTECSIHQNCKPWQFYGYFWSLQQSGHKTANHVSSMATTFKIIFSPQKCKPWQFYGHFSESTKSGQKIANLGNSMATGISETRFESARPRLKMSKS